MRLSDAPRSEKLREVFDGLEARQPAHYKLSPKVKNAVVTADWPLVLDAARGLVDSYREEDFDIVAGITALICGVD